MVMHDALILFGLFLIFLGLGLLIYMQLFGLLMRFHVALFPKLAKRYDRLLCLQSPDERPTGDLPAEVTK